MGVAMVEGFQGDSLNNPYSIAACAKHFVAYGASEGGRDYNSTFIPERLMRNVYLPPFEAAKNAGCATFMASFNDNDGVPSSGNKHILTDILRGEWHFDGFVVSDWNSVSEMFIHGFVKDHKQAAKVALEAGLDMDMASYAFARYLKDLVKEGNLDEAKIDEAVRRILRIKVRLGLFENPYVDTTAVKRNTYTEESLAKAQKAAEESIILLKNENKVLPIDENKVKTVALIGPFIDAKRDQLGTWIFDGEAEHTQTPLEAIKTQFGDKVKIIVIKQD
jgi:beta-glucosidase